MTLKRVPALLLAATVGGALVIPPAKAQSQNVPAAPEALTPVQIAERHLKEGRRYSRAIALLTEEAAKAPSADAYRLLGMAYAARYASLGFARHQVQAYEGARWGWERRRERREKADANGDPNAEDIVVPRPPDPPVTPDDGKPFTLAPEKSRAEMIRLGNKCLDAFEQARSLAGADKGKVTAVENARGWSVLLLQRMGQGVVTTKPPTPPSAPATGKAVETLLIGEWDAAPSFAVCARNEPKSADFHHALALARAPRRLMPRVFAGSGFAFEDLPDGGKKKNLGSSHTASGKPEDAPESAWQVACALRPNDWELAYQRALYRVVDDPAAAVELLREAVRLNPTDAALWYRLAALRRMSEGADIDPESFLRDIEAGNLAPIYTQSAWRLPTPAPLRKAWTLEPVYGYGEDFVLLQLVAGPLTDQLRKDLDGDKEDRALRNATALLILAVKAASGFQSDDLTVQYETQKQTYGRRFITTVYGLGAYHLIRKAHTAKPSDAKAAFVARYAALFEQLTNLEKAILNMD